jgi:ABC-2 type transport system ATP-binding protein
MTQVSWAIKAEKLCKDYPGIRAVSDVDFKINSGVIHGFLGPNGAGKSTTIKMICGLLRPTSGRVLVEGIDPCEEAFKVKKMIGLLPEIPPLYKEMTVGEYLRFVGRLHDLSSQQLKESLYRVVEQTHLSSVLPRLIGNLSKGFRQRVGIAQALIHDPKVVILDEPTSGLDPESVVEVRELIKKLKGQKTILFSSHLLHEVEEICDTISIIDRGRLLTQGLLQDVRASFQEDQVIRIEVKESFDLSLLKDLPYVVSVDEQDWEKNVLVLRIKSSTEVRDLLIDYLMSRGVRILEFKKMESLLEDIFLKVIKQGKSI